MKKLLVLMLLIAAPVAAQNRPGKFSTLTTTDTTADSVHVGCAVGSSTCTGGLKAGPITGSTGVFTGAVSGTTGTFTGVVVSNATTTGNKTFTLGGSPADNSAAFIQMLSSNTQKNWRIGANASIAGAFELVPSTAAGGSTFTTPVLTILATGVYDFNGKWGIDANGNLTNGASAHIADSNGTPSIASGFGTAAAVTGTDYAMSIATGTSGTTTGTINFGHTFSSAPICVATRNTTDGGVVSASSSTTQVALVYTSSTLNLPLYVLCRGY